MLEREIWLLLLRLFVCLFTLLVEVMMASKMIVKAYFMMCLRITIAYYAV